jgi:hypothetical protein
MPLRRACNALKRAREGFKTCLAPKKDTIYIGVHLQKRSITFFYKIPFRLSNSIRKNPAATLLRILNPKKSRTTF